MNFVIIFTSSLNDSLTLSLISLWAINRFYTVVKIFRFFIYINV